MVKKTGVKSKEKISNDKPFYKHKRFIPLVVGVVILAILIILLFVELSTAEAALGDTVSVNYVGSFENGTIFDTNVESVGLQAGIEKPEYSVFTFTLGQGQVVPGFENNIVGMGVGDKKNFTLTPEEAYGQPREELFITDLKRDLNVTKHSIVPIAQYSNLFDNEPEVGAILERQDIPWQLKIAEVNDTHVKIENVLVLGQSVNMSGVEWGASVSDVNEEVITIRQNPEIGKRLAFPTQGGMVVAIVTAVNEETFEADANHPLAGMSLNFEVELKEIKKPN